VHLLYLDESGKSGPKDFDQPWYVLGGLIVEEADWRPMENALNKRIEALVPSPRAASWEIHMAQIHHRKGDFRDMPASTRWALVDAVFDVLDQFDTTLIFTAVHKERHQNRYAKPDPVEGIAYMLMVERFEKYLHKHAPSQGVIVCDEQKEDEASRRAAHSAYRKSGTGWLTIEHVIETPFFTPSHWSRMLQMIDVATYYAAKHLAGKLSTYWPRIEPHLDGYPGYDGRGLKRFP